MQSSRRGTKRRSSEMAEEGVQKNGLFIHIKQGNVFKETREIGILAVTVDETLKGRMVDALKKKLGDVFYQEALKTALSIRSRKVMPGEFLPLNVLGSGSSPQIEYVALVVSPMFCHLKMAYKSLLDFASTNNCSSIVMSGIGCGEMGVEPGKSAGKLNDVIEENTAGFGPLKLQLGMSVHSVHVFPSKAVAMKPRKRIAKNKKKNDKTVRIVDHNKAVVDAFNKILGGVASGSGEEMDEVVMNARLYTRRVQQPEADTCSVCMDSMTNGEEVVSLLKCSHQIHFDCFVNMLKSTHRKSCWICNKFFAPPEGNMPQGTMRHTTDTRTKIPGYEDAPGCIVINYNISGGVQGPTHIRPGRHFSGTHRIAYLPNNDKGRKVLRLLERAFACKLTFTVGDSITSGAQNVVVWNNIHHKTNIDGGPQAYGYPDPDYMDRVIEELAVQGIVDEEDEQ